MSPSIPDWFQNALDTPYDTHRVDVDSCSIHHVSWGKPGKPGVILVHGGLAHIHWWRFIAPFLANHYHVVALDLSGHGDSGWRETYPRNVWAREVIQVADARFERPPVLVGHSMGGIVSTVTSALYGDKLAGCIVIDAPIHKRVRREPEQGQQRTFKHIRPYDNLDEAMTRFRFLPDQTVEHTFIRDHLARTSLHQVEEGWIWKFDRMMFEKLQVTPLDDLFAKIAIPWMYIRGEWSKVAPAGIENELNAKFGRPMPIIEIPNAHHHLMLDQPLAFITTLRALLESWGHRRTGTEAHGE